MSIRVRGLLAPLAACLLPLAPARALEHVAPADSSAVETEILVGADEFWGRLQQDLAGARRRVLVQTMSFEGDSAGHRLTEALLRCPASDRRLLLDAYTWLALSDRFVYSPRFWFSRRLRAEVRATRGLIARLRGGGVAVQVTNEPGRNPLAILTRNHKKLVVVDSLSYVGGINFSDHNFEWHDLMLRFADRRLADSLAADFETTWAGRNEARVIRCGSVEIHALDGRGNDLAVRPLIDHLDAARDSIWVESAYLTFPFYDALRRARRRGVRVTHVAPLVNNKGIFDSYAIWEARRSGIELRHFPRMTHMKAMVIDGEVVVGGSVNFDYMSTRTQQELLLILRDPRLARRMIDRVAGPDNRASARYEGDERALRGRAAYWQMLLVDRVAAALARGIAVDSRARASNLEDPGGSSWRKRR